VSQRDGAADWLELAHFRGCPYVNTIAELADVEADHRVRAAARLYMEEVGAHFRRLAVAAGAAAAIGDEIHLLLAGSIELATAYRAAAPIQAARSAAVKFLAGSP
jgi:hypothetical protein